MPDSFSKEERSSIMTAVKSHGNKSTELKLIKIFRENNITGWRRKHKIFGNPDFVFPKRRIVVFADGCFWHGHNCRNTKPKDNAEYWHKKIRKNRARDRLATKTLEGKGWTVFRIWECRINKKKLPAKFLHVFE